MNLTPNLDRRRDLGRSRLASLGFAILVLVVPVLLVLGCGEGREREIGARLSVAAALGGVEDEGYARATEVRDLDFPADHGPHPDFRTEWWYFTGNLVAADAFGTDGEPRRFGYQLTFFRTAVAPPEGAGDGDAASASDWRTRQMYMAHFALTDVAGERFSAAERFRRGAAGLAGAEAAPFRVWTGSWSAATEGPGAPSDGEPDTRTGTVAGTARGFEDGTADDGDFFPLRLVAADDPGGAGAFAIDLRLQAGKGRVLQGELGLSRKGPEEGNASYYYSYPRMPTRGTVTVAGETFRVEGASWLDREWSTSVLGEGQAGWDWFALQLDSLQLEEQASSAPAPQGRPFGNDAATGRELVFYRIRSDAEIGTDAEGSGDLDYAALVPPEPDEAADGEAADGEATRSARLRVLDLEGARLEVLDRWTSPRSGVTWPSGWRVRIPSADVDLWIRPRLRDQELNLAIRYWEGSVEVEGAVAGDPVRGQGYAELTGYGDTAARAR